MISARFIHIVACVRICFLFEAEEYCIAYLYHILFTHSSVDKLLGVFYLWLLWIRLLWTWMCKYLLEILLLLLLDISPEVELQYHMIFFFEVAILFPQILQDFTFPLTMHKHPNVSTPLPTPVIFWVCLFICLFAYNSHPNGCEVVSCGFWHTFPKTFVHFFKTRLFLCWVVRVPYLFCIKVFHQLYELQISPPILLTVFIMLVSFHPQVFYFDEA